jgi:hypothetical protein
MTQLPAPLVPANVDLRDFLFTPVEFQRLFASETWLMCNDAEKVAAITLWGNSWSQLPAGSMPSDDRLLAHLSGAGKAWKRIKPMAMRGWVLCSDDRYYHPVMCEKALEAWLEKLAQRLSSGAGNAKRWGTDFNPAGIIDEINHSRWLLAALNPKSRALAKKPPKAPDSNPDGKEKESRRDEKIVPSGSQETGTGTGNLKTTLSPERDDRLDLPGLTGYHTEHWQPDQPRLQALMQRAGIPMPDHQALANSLTRFNLHYAGKSLTDGETYSKLVSWLTGDHRRERTQNSADPHALTAGHRKPSTPLDRAIAARNAALGPRSNSGGD